MMALEPGETGAFLRRLGQVLDRGWGRPSAVVAISAHTTARAPVILGGARHEAVHDFGGFPKALYELRYDAPGEPRLAGALGDGLEAQVLDQGGLDHGIWTALRYLYPQADVPVVPLALTPMASPAELMALGERLGQLMAPGRPFEAVNSAGGANGGSGSSSGQTAGADASDGPPGPAGLSRVLVLATGSITHNLRLLMRGGPGVALPGSEGEEMAESAAFRSWFAQRSDALDWPALADYRRQAPHAALMHPTDEHLLPWYVAAGAGGRADAPRRIHAGVTFGCLGMDAYAFGPQAKALDAALAGG